MFVYMQSERLWFRSPEVADAPIVGRWINDERVRPFLATPLVPFGLEAEKAFCERHSSAGGDWKQRTDVAFLFGLKGEPLDKPIGSTGLHNIYWIVRNAEWGILIGEPEQWNKGFGREVARRMVRYAFEQLQLNRVSLRVHANHHGGIKAYKAAGFVQEGNMRQGAVGFDGNLVDLLDFGILRSEWKR